MSIRIVLQVFLALVIVDNSNAISSPLRSFNTYNHSTELKANTADLWWTVDEDKREITFELHMKTTGWIALGISPAGGMKGADIGVGWVDQTGIVHFEDRYASDFARPIIDTTTTDWFAIHGREEMGWTAIQFKRLLDTCDKMDVPIKAGSDILIFAYGLVDPDPSQPNGDISYHGDRRGTRIIPLRSYADPPSEDKFTGLDTFDLSLNNYAIPAADTTYYCKVFKAPSEHSEIRHAIAYKVIVDPKNIDLVHHITLYECDSAAQFDDSSLTADKCDDVAQQITPCAANLATGWAVGGDLMFEYSEEAGYPIGVNFEIKYYMLQIHYTNPSLLSNRMDSSGIRFYIGNELRQHDLGYFTFGTGADPLSLAIPPKVDRFVVDSYCTANNSAYFPETDITLLSAFPHTHLPGRSVWTKLIRNQTAVQYVFNDEAFDFNYQFQNSFSQRIILYPGDEFATRCIYNTMNKEEITLGGERTKDEMCLHTFQYFPRIHKIYGCVTKNSEESWKIMMKSNSSSKLDYQDLKQWLRNLKWTPELATEWQEFYDKASRLVVYGPSDHSQYKILPHIPEYKDLKSEECKIRNSTDKKNPAFGIMYLILLTLIPFLIKQFSAL